MSETSGPPKKSESVRAYLRQHPDANHGDVVAALAAQGIQVSRQFVSVVQDSLKLSESSAPEQRMPPAPDRKMPPGHVTHAEGLLFYKLYAALCSFASIQLKLVPELPADPKQFTVFAPEARVRVREALFARRELIDQFVQDNPAGLTDEELAVVAGWKHAVMGSFYVLRYLKRHAIFLSDEKPPRAFGVLALASPFEEVVGPHLPVLVKGLLLPIHGRITYDAVLAPYSISFGPGLRKSLNAVLEGVQESRGLIASLPEGSAPPEVKKKTPRKKPAAVDPADAKAVLETVVGLTDAFCRDYLNDEYALVCRNLAAALARKRPSPLLRGKPETWACGILRTIGWVNFLDDSSRKPHLKLTFIDRALGVAESTGQQKSRDIRKMLRIRDFDRKWTLPSQLDQNPQVWLVSVDGFILDIRQAARDLQVQAYEAGLIPYIPADRKDG
jgi:hypothetical protein